MKSISFLFPVNGKNLSGGLKVVCEYANRFAVAGYDVHIVYAGSIFFSKKTIRYKLSGVVRYIQTLFRGYSCKGWFSLDHRVKEHWAFSLNQRHVPETDVYIATAPYTAMYLNEYDIDASRKFYFIQGYENWGGVTDQKLRETYHYPATKIVISNWLQRILAEEGQKSTLIPNGFDFEKFKVLTPIEQKDKYSVTMVYHSMELKDCNLGFNALDKVHQKIPQLRVKLFGLPPKPDNLPDWYDYTQRPDAETHCRLYDESAIFIATSRSEGWGLTLGESMLCGCAVCCTDIDGYKEMAVDKENALLSPVGDVERMAENITYLIENDELRVRLAQAANESIRKFNWNNSFKIYKKLIDTNGREK